MLRISTKGYYGVRLMLELALNYQKGLVLLKDIAKRQNISEKYLEHIVVSLRATGLILSYRGAHGGYSLAKSPSEITLKDIIQVLEGPIFVVECIDIPTFCDKVEFCVSRDIWKVLSEKIIHTLESVTLENMIEMQKNKEMDYYNYCI